MCFYQISWVVIVFVSWHGWHRAQVSRLVYATLLLPTYNGATSSVFSSLQESFGVPGIPSMTHGHLTYKLSDGVTVNPYEYFIQMSIPVIPFLILWTVLASLVSVQSALETRELPKKLAPAFVTQWLTLTPQVLQTKAPNNVIGSLAQVLDPLCHCEILTPLLFT